MTESKADMGRFVIQNVPRPQGANTVLASLASALRTGGEDITYSYLMGVSSHAFRLQFNWYPSAPHSHCGFNTFDPALRAIGYKATDYPLAMWEAETRKRREATPEEIEAARRAVKWSIDAGTPVLINAEECAILAGYEPVSEENPTGWLFRPGPLGPPPTGDELYVSPVKDLPWCICVVKKGESIPPERKQSIIWSLKTAVQSAHVQKLGIYSMGFAAWERWIRELADLRPVIGESQEQLDKFDTEESAPFEIQLGNAWCYESLIDARRQATGYLRSIAGDFSASAAEHLSAAADAYERVVTALLEGADCFTHIAPYPWMKDIQWTNQGRKEQSERLKKALPHERGAIAAIAEALKAEEAVR